MVLVAAQRRVTGMLNMPGVKKAQPITFWPNRVNRCPQSIWEKLVAKRGGVRDDGKEPEGPFKEYLETGILWLLTPAQANLVSEGKAKLTSPHGPISSAFRPQPREPKPVEGLDHVAEINSATLETVSVG